MTQVQQIGTDRIIQVQFSEGRYSVFLEFYAGGNIVLTDNDLTVLALWRNVTGERAQEDLRAGLRYSLTDRQNYGGVPALCRDRVRDALQDSSPDGPPESARKGKKKTSGLLKKALARSFPEFPSILVEHALLVHDFDGNLPPDQVLLDESLIDGLVTVLQEAEKVTRQISEAQSCSGYIIAKPGKRTESGPGDPAALPADGHSAVHQGLIYEDFHPFKPRQFEADPACKILTFDGFNKTVDEFFSSIEGQKLESRLHEREDNAKKKLETARQDHAKRLGGLQTVQELNIRKAQAIEANVARVEEAVAAINGLIGQGMDWVEIARLIEMEQGRRNPVAETIKLPLKLYENTATLLLPELDEEDDYEGASTDSDVSQSDGDEDSSSPKPGPAPREKRLAVDVDLALTPWANARQYYDQKRSAAVKEQKTLQSSSKALKSTEKKITADLKKGLKQEKEVLRPVRQQFWFEKFLFFISSDGYLVLA